MATHSRSVPSQNLSSVTKNELVLEKLGEILVNPTSRSLLYESIKNNDAIFGVLSELLTDSDNMASNSQEREHDMTGKIITQGKRRRETEDEDVAPARPEKRARQVRAKHILPDPTRMMSLRSYQRYPTRKGRKGNKESKNNETTVKQRARRAPPMARSIIAGPSGRRHTTSRPNAVAGPSKSSSNPQAKDPSLATLIENQPTPSAPHALLHVTDADIPQQTQLGEGRESSVARGKKRRIDEEEEEEESAVGRGTKKRRVLEEEDQLHESEEHNRIFNIGRGEYPGALEEERIPSEKVNILQNGAEEEEGERTLADKREETRVSNEINAGASEHAYSLYMDSEAGRNSVPPGTAGHITTQPGPSHRRRRHRRREPSASAFVHSWVDAHEEMAAANNMSEDDEKDQRRKKRAPHRSAEVTPNPGTLQVETAVPVPVVPTVSTIGMNPLMEDYLRRNKAKIQSKQAKR